MDRWGPMLGYAHCALRGNGYHDALGGGARAPSASTAPYAAAQATPPPPPLALPARRVPRGSGEKRYGHMLHGVRAEQGCARSKERRACVLLGAMSGCRP